MNNMKHLQLILGVGWDRLGYSNRIGDNFGKGGGG